MLIYKYFFIKDLQEDPSYAFDKNIYISTKIFAQKLKNNIENSFDIMYNRKEIDLKLILLNIAITELRHKNLLKNILECTS